MSDWLLLQELDALCASNSPQKQSFAELTACVRGLLQMHRP